MRDLIRQKQKVWICVLEKRELVDGDGNLSGEWIELLSKPIEKRIGVSATAGNPYHPVLGMVLNYTRVLTTHDKRSLLKEGDLLFIDVIPQIDEFGELIISDDGVQPITVPDYIVVKTMAGQKGAVSRFGIAKR